MNSLKLYNLKEVSKILGLSVDTLREKIKKGELKASKVGIEYKITEEAIKDYLKSNEVQPKQEK